LNEAMPDLPDEVKKVAIYYIDIDGRAALDKFIKEQNSTAVDVELRDLKQILDDVVLNDIIEYDLKKVKGGYELELTRLVSDRLQQEIDKYNQKRGLPLFETIEEDDEQESETPKKKKFTPIEISDNGLELVELISLDCSNDSGPWKSDSEIKINKKGFVIRDGKQTRDFWDAKISSKKKPLRLKVRNIAGDETIVSLA
jgi:adenine-specific DNA-methyltransferase